MITVSASGAAESRTARDEAIEGWKRGVAEDGRWRGGARCVCARIDTEKTSVLEART